MDVQSSVYSGRRCHHADGGRRGEVKILGVAFLLLAVLSGSAYAVISRAISDDFTVYERSLVMQLMGAVFYTAAAFLKTVPTLP